MLGPCRVRTCGARVSSDLSHFLSAVLLWVQPLGFLSFKAAMVALLFFLMLVFVLNLSLAMMVVFGQMMLVYPRICPWAVMMVIWMMDGLRRFFP